MKKTRTVTLILVMALMFSIILPITASADPIQVTEKFTTEAVDSKTFSEGGLTFNITGPYLHVDDYQDGVAWGHDDYLYVSNFNNAMPAATVAGSFVSTGSDFNVNSLYLITLNESKLIEQTNDILIRGKLDGSTKFTHTVLYNTINNTPTNNYYTYVDLSSYSSQVIDELEFEVDPYEAYFVSYLMIDDFKFTEVIPAPVVTDANISISGASGTGGTYKIGDTVTATWNNTALGDNNSDISSVTVNFSQFGGGSAVAATNSSGTWTATYTIVSGDISGTNKNISVTATDSGANSTTTADTTNATVDNTIPTVSSVSVPANGTYRAGQNLDFTVNMNEAVTVNTGGGTPRLALTVGASTVYANYISGSGTSAIVFRYTVQSGEADSDGISVGALSLNGGTIRDAAGNNASLTLNSVGSTTGVLVDTASPTVSSVSVPANGTYRAGQNLDFTVNMNEAVTVNTGG